MTPPAQVLELTERSERERFERNLDHYKRPAYKETEGHVEHEDMPDNQDRGGATSYDATTVE